MFRHIPNMRAFKGNFTQTFHKESQRQEIAKPLEPVWVTFNREKQSAKQDLWQCNRIGNWRNRTFILQYSADDETCSHKDAETEKGENQHFQESV